MKTIGEKLDDLLARQTREYLDNPSEYKECKHCGGLGQIRNIVDGCWYSCPACNGTGSIKVE